MNIFSSNLPENARSGRLGALAHALRAGRAGSRASGRTEAPTIDGVTGAADPATGPAARRATGPDWLNFVPSEVRSLVASHLPAGLPDYLGEAASSFSL